MTHFKPLIAAMFAVLAAGCSKPPTVKDYLADPELLKKTISECRKDPMKFINDVNCINANSANNKKSLQNLREGFAEINKQRQQQLQQK